MTPILTQNPNWHIHVAVGWFCRTRRVPRTFSMSPPRARAASTVLPKFCPSFIPICTFFLKNNNLIIYFKIKISVSWLILFLYCLSTYCSLIKLETFRNQFKISAFFKLVTTLNSSSPLSYFLLHGSRK